MSLFQNSVLNKYLRGLDPKKVNEAYERFTSHFHNPTIQENIRNSKEEQYQEGFLIDLFVNILGYIKNPTPNFNLTTELKNIKGSKKTDGAILKGEKALAVIELKGTNTTDLSKVENQAFGYKNNQPGCNYVITSNFGKLRFYIDNAVDFEEFNLFQLTKERFDILWLCLSSEYLLKDIPKKIKDESLTREENITKELYKDYASFRNDIFDAIQKENPEYNKLTLFKKTQKLLDRFLFIFFAEDRLLLPPNSIRSIVNQWADLRDKYDEYFPLYDRFRKYFGYMNTGHKGQQHDIFAYNGGLFAPDDILDNIKINDELLYKHTVNLSNYDFESEVSVNILGHIFEHSLNDIDEIQAQIQGITTEQSKTKRKKDGVFYTPKYITKYIVDNTVGKLCEEKKTELDIQEAEYEKERKGRQKATLKKLTQKLEDYRKWLLQVTICDPACGSGAFLNQALEFLITEHQYIDELQAKLLGDAIIFREVENSILENNLFGVDINDESVEIAKLSLWLRTAQKGRKLTSLNNNIKCGNSLIEDPIVAGEKAFNWRKEFPEVFAKGGFDAIIGNPPYVRQELIPKDQKEYLANNYEVGNMTADLYVYFYERGIKSVKNKGILAYITPNKFYKTRYGKELRTYLKNIKLIELIDFFELRVFQDASTDSQILTLVKDENQGMFEYSPIQTISNFREGNYKKIQITQSELNVDSWIFNDIQDVNILNKISAKSIPIDEYTNSGVYRGVMTGLNDAFIIDEYTKTGLINDDPKSSDLIKPYVSGTEIVKYSLRIPKKRYLLHIKWDFIPTEYPAIMNHLIKYKERLEKRPEVKEGRYNWYAMSRYASDYYHLFEQPKIIYIYTAVNHPFHYDNEGYFINNSGYLISNADKYLLAWLNSKIFTYYKKLIFVAYGDSSGKGRVKLDYNKMVNVPIPIADTESRGRLVAHAEEMLKSSKVFESTNDNFIKLLESKYTLDKVAKKLHNWYLLDFGEFLKELDKARKKSAKENETEYRKLSLSEEAEWMQYFNEQKQKAKELKTEIDEIDRKIDQIVYELYGLTEDEIKVVEEASK
jgi:hypothetical protein